MLRCVAVRTLESHHDHVLRQPGRGMLADVALPELDVARVKRWCDLKVPDRMSDRVRVECETSQRHLTILETRPPLREPSDGEWTRTIVARLYYRSADRLWQLYWSDRNQRLHAYDMAAPSIRVNDLLAEIDADPTGIFWG
jgi:hypothetical protein